MCEKRFPNALIIGAEKGATGALLRFLGQHPQIVRIHENKEMHFFSTNYDKGLQWYKEQMPYSLPGQIVIEKSVSYIVHNKAPERVFELNPGIKSILCVRNPTERAISEYAMHKAMFEKNNRTINRVPEAKLGEPFPPFEEIWQRYMWVFYDTDLENWLKYFSLKQIHVVDGHELVKSPVPELKKIEKFLNIDPVFDEKQFYFDLSKGFYCLTHPRFKPDKKMFRAGQRPSASDCELKSD